MLEMMSGKLPPVRVSVWVRVKVRFRFRFEGQYSSGAIFLELLDSN